MSAHSQALLDIIRARGNNGQFVDYRFLPARAAEYGSWPDWLPSSLVSAWKKQGVDSPWLHQLRALQAIHCGHDVVIATGTGSGKSLVAWTPILSDLLNAEVSSRISDIHHRPTCLYLSPTKALAADQLHSLNELIGALPEQLSVALADGDTPREAKNWARAHADIVLTNPDYLHYVMLPNHERWMRVLASLRYVIVDEMHQWRGVSGSHISLVLRRLLRIARHLGARVQVIMMSATLSDPQSVAQTMIGREKVDAITEDTSGRGTHHVFMWEGREVPREDEVSIESFLSALQAAEAGEEAVLEAPTQRISAQTEAALLSAELVRNNARLLTFVRSRGGAETVAAQTRENLHDSPELASTVAAYRGGFLPEERRALEAALRSGQLRALATTSALEMGIDISGLDVTITAGWPGTRASFWQQVGRSGRAGAEGISVLIACDNPLDSFLVHHSDEIFSPVEAAVLDPDNPWVLRDHLCAAAGEIPLSDREATEVFGPRAPALLAQLGAEGQLVNRSGGWRWNITSDEQPWDRIQIRGSGRDVQIVDARSGSIIGSVPQDSADSQVFPDAIYIHQGRTFHVLSLEEGPARLAYVEEVRTPLRTRAQDAVSIRIVDVDEEWVSGDSLVHWYRGSVDVTRQVTDFDLLRLPGLEFISNTQLAMPERTLRTQACWYTLSPSTMASLGIDRGSVLGALHAAEHASIALLPLCANCDRWDLGGLSTNLHTDTNLPTVFVHDSYPGGAGYAHFGFKHAREWIERTYQAVAECQCHDGCPRCIQSPKCGNGNEPLSKEGARRLLEFLCEHSPFEEIPRKLPDTK